MRAQNGVGLATTTLIGTVAVLATVIFFIYPGSNLLPSNETTNPINPPPTDITKLQEEPPKTSVATELQQECSSLSVPQDECTEENVAAKKVEKYGSYTQSGQIAIRSAALITDGTGSIDMVNRGGIDESITTISVTNFGRLIDNGSGTDIFVGAIGTAPIIPANGEAIVEFSDVTRGGITPLAGQTVTLTITTAQGQAYTISLVVSG